MNPYLGEVSAKIWELSSLKQLKVSEVPLFYRHSTPLECEGLPIPFSIDIALRWSAKGIPSTILMYIKTKNYLGKR